MPLKSGSSQKVIGENIRELHHGKTFAKTESKFGKKRADKQAIAIAFSQAGKGRAFGGVAPMMGQAFNPVANGRAMGVAATPQSLAGLPANASSPLSRPLARGGPAFGGVKPAKMTTGPLVSAVPGRTDLHFTHVPSGSYVIPADIVSGHGQGNTLAGMTKLHNMFKMNSYKQYNPALTKNLKGVFSRGGSAEKHVGKPVPVKLAGGEIVVPPGNLHDTMQRIRGKKMSLEQAHAEMDKWVVDERKKLRKTLAKLSGPVKD